MLSAAHAARPETGQESLMTQGTRGLSQRQRLPPRLRQPRSLQPRHQPPGVQNCEGGKQRQRTRDRAHPARPAHSPPLPPGLGLPALTG